MRGGMQLCVYGVGWQARRVAAPVQRLGWMVLGLKGTVSDAVWADGTVLAW